MLRKSIQFVQRNQGDIRIKQKNIKKISFTLDFIVQICCSLDMKHVATSFNKQSNMLQILL